MTQIFHVQVGANEFNVAPTELELEAIKKQFRKVFKKTPFIVTDARVNVTELYVTETDQQVKE